MTTNVTVTGTGIPPIEPGRAGPGALVRCRGTDGSLISLQFDAGRATALRLAEAKVSPASLDAVFVTHHHSDHVSGIPDLVFCAWLNRPVSTDLDFVTPAGPAQRFLERMLDPYDDDLALRVAHTGRAYPNPAITAFAAGPEVSEVWERNGVRVSATTVRHQPVEPAVGYRVDTPDGAVVISGDTRVCDELEDLARGCDVLVHEAFRVDAYVEQASDDTARVLGEYHADTVALGAMARRLDPGVMMLTHLCPQPRTDADKAAFVDDVRRGGFEGEVIVCDDLASVEFDARGLVVRSRT